MTDVSKVQQWVQKAVADIAAFDGNLRKVDKDAEKKALSTLLAGNNLTQDDKDYIEGFMLDKSAKAEKINGLKPKKNENRVVEMPYGEPTGATFEKSNEDIMNQIKATHHTVRLFFDEEGNVVTNEIRGENGELTVLTNVKRISESEIEVTSEQNMLDGSTVSRRGISNGERDFEKAEYKPLDMVLKKENEVLQEQHTDADGVTVKKTYLNTENKTFLLSVPVHNVDNPQEFMSKVATVEEVYQNGAVTVKYHSADGEVLLSQEGHYTQDRFGNFNTQFPIKDK